MMAKTSRTLPVLVTMSGMATTCPGIATSFPAVVFAVTPLTRCTTLVAETKESFLSRSLLTTSARRKSSWSASASSLSWKPTP